jgi:hypothetical protein
MGWRSRLEAWFRRAVMPTSAAGIAVLSLALAPLAAASTGPASGGPGMGGTGIPGEFGLAPAPGPQGQLTPYFQLAVAPGHAATATVVVANLAKQAQTLALSRAIGVTAGNGGSAYLPPSGRCSGPACWVTGLPSRITLPAGYREMVAFTVRVPRRTPPGQYLTGIDAAPAARPTPVKLSSNGSSSSQAVILHVVTVGVAITVGDPSSLVSRLSIRGVQGVTEGPTARLNISLYNTGQTFAKSTGQASCRAGGRRSSYPVYADIVLPGDHALIAVNAPGLPEGASVPCAIRVRYGKGQVVSWTGLVAIPGSLRGRVVQTGKGAYTLIPPQNGIPRWGIALIIIGLLLLAAVSVLLYRQRRPSWQPRVRRSRASKLG